MVAARADSPTPSPASPLVMTSPPSPKRASVVENDDADAEDPAMDSNVEDACSRGGEDVLKVTTITGEGNKTRYCLQVNDALATYVDAIEIDGVRLGSASRNSGPPPGLGLDFPEGPAFGAPPWSHFDPTFAYMGYMPPPGPGYPPLPWPSSPFDASAGSWAGYDAPAYPPTLPDKPQRVKSEPPRHDAPTDFPKLPGRVKSDPTPQATVDEEAGLPSKSSSEKGLPPKPPALERTLTLTSLRADSTANGCTVQWILETRKVMETRDRVAVSSSFVIAPSGRPEFPGNFKIILTPKVAHDRKGGASFKSAKGMCLIQMKWGGDSCDETTIAAQDIELKLSVRGSAQAEADRMASATLRHNFASNMMASLRPADGQAEEWNLAQAVADGSRTLVFEIEIALGVDEKA